MAEENKTLDNILKGVQIAAPLGGTILGGILSKEEREKQKQNIEQTAKLFEESGLPPDLSKQLALQQFQTGPLLNPFLEENVDIGPSSVASMQVSPEGRQTQMEALEAYKQLASLGLSPTDRASLNKVRDEVAAQSEGKRQQILQQMMSRGVSGSGQELAAQLSAEQQGSQQASREADRLAALAFEGRRSALANMGSMGTQVRSNDFEEEKTRRTAQDLFQQYATQNSISRQQRNVASQNLAEAGNIGRQQGTSDKNVAMANAEMDRQNKAKQEMYQQMLNRASAGQGVYSNLGQYYGNQAANQQQNVSNIGQQVGSIAKNLGDSGLLSSIFGKSTETPKTPDFSGVDPQSQGKESDFSSIWNLF